MVTKGILHMADGIWILAAAVIAFAVTGLLGKWLVPFLHKINFGPVSYTHLDVYKRQVGNRSRDDKTGG